MKRVASLLILAGLLSGCTLVPESGARQGASQPRYAMTTGSSTPRSPVAQPGSLGTSAPPVAIAPEDRQCLAQLSATGAQFTALPDSYTGQGCSTIGTVQMAALRGDIANMSISNIGPVQCGLGTAFAAWARYGVDRAARQLLGSPLARIETMGSYACRNVAGSARRSAHATAGAIDVSGFVLEDGRRISLTEDWHGGTADEREFLRTVQRSACRRFGTVLGPEYNAAHRDHFHLEGVIDGSSFCR